MSQNNQHKNEIKADYEIFSAGTEKVNITILTNASYLTAGEKLVFTVYAGVKDSNYSIQPNSMFMDIYDVNNSENETRLAFVNSEKKGKYVSNYSFTHEGKYSFTLTLGVIDNSNNVRNEEVSFTKEVMKSTSVQNEKSGSGFLGMGTMMLIMMGAVMLVLMIVIGINHR